MLNRIIEFSLRNRMLVMIAGVVLLIAGTYTARKMEVDVFPDLNAPTVVVMTEASGMAAEEVERTVTFPIETAVNGATDVRRVRSSSTSGFSVVWVEFDWGTDIYLARQIVSEKLAALSETLPSNVGTPTLGPQSSILGGKASGEYNAKRRMEKLAVETGVKVYVNDKPIVPTDVNGKTVDVLLYKGTTYLPVRAVSNALDQAVAWDGASYSVYIGSHKDV